MSNDGKKLTLEEIRKLILIKSGQYSQSTGEEIKKLKKELEERMKNGEK
jgi:hypothetical protein